MNIDEAATGADCASSGASERVVGPTRYPVEVLIEGGGVRVVQGPRVPRSLSAQVALWTAAARTSREPDCPAVLVIDAMFGAPLLHEVRALVQDVLVPGWGAAKLAWLLLEPSVEGRASVAEVWTRLAGVNARAFVSEVAAREWIASG